MALNPIFAFRPEFPFVCFSWKKSLEKLSLLLLVFSLSSPTPWGFAEEFLPFDLASMTQTMEKRDALALYGRSVSHPLKGIFKNGAAFPLPAMDSGWVSYSLNEPALYPVNMEFAYKKSAGSKNDFGKYQALADDSFTITMMAVGAIGVLYMTPTSFSNWEERDLSPDAMGSRYSHKVSDGPVVDKDDGGINYIGHPYFGGAYYIHARHLGYQRNEAFMFSFLMSTVMYEYGVEAFFERPSMQDLVTTPVAGSVVGELMMLGERRIRANGMRVLGSEILGRVSMVFLNPIGFTIEKIDRMAAIFPNTHVKTEFFAYQVRSEEGFDDARGKGGSRDFRCGVEITWFRR
jgi:hypothetical protein